ncbi:unnamed protein product [Eruca vesicaria subsp. sativa]|uniref:HHO5-like N-terminal domain-containing protein n=1 Tax=Eruca vesicaria subsp. sativa TaxID=29727 RepID=A0ABC8J502_ERUVS|nr:unnamed protein product [Eruca vesicaria subsp. sativa]
MNGQKLEEEKIKIQASVLDLPLCLQILNDAILYFKEENKRCSEMDTQPLLKDFISGDGPLLKREEKKLQLWTENDHIPNGRFSDTKQLWCRRSKYAILNPKTSLWDSSCRHNKILSLVASFFAAAWSKNKLQVIVGTLSVFLLC